MSLLRKLRNNNLPTGHQGVNLHKVQNINLIILVDPLCLCALVVGKGIPGWAKNYF